jgi:hypothetical protein
MAAASRCTFGLRRSTSSSIDAAERWTARLTAATTSPCARWPRTTSGWTSSKFRSMRWRCFSTAVLLGVVAAAGSAVATTADRAHDRALAKRITIHLSDLPIGWRTDAVTPSSSRCSAIESLESLETARAETRFSKELDAAGSTVGVFPSTVVAKQVYDRYAGNFRACGAKLPIGRVSVGALSFPHVGDRSKAWNVRGTVNGVVVHVDVLLVGVGRADAVYEFAGAGRGSPRLDARIVRKAVSRA